MVCLPWPDDEDTGLLGVGRGNFPFFEEPKQHMIRPCNTAGKVLDPSEVREKRSMMLMVRSEDLRVEALDAPLKRSVARRPEQEAEVLRFARLSASKLKSA